MRRLGLALLLLMGCGSEAVEVSIETNNANTNAMTTANETSSTNQSNNANSLTNGSTTAPDEEPQPCGCPIGDGSYCGARAKGLAAAQGCELDQSVVDDNTLYICEDGAWATLNDCDGECLYDEASTELDDLCEIPECDCFVQVAWCGTGAGKKAETLGCKIPILPEHNGDILHCPGGNWAVKEACDKGCIEAPEGTPDECRTESQYLLPFNCGMATRCSNGNHTSSHSGTDEYAYDFAVPVGTNVRAMRGGVVHRVRIVSKPGSACYNGGGSSCANYANTVEIRHNDGSIGLYMHIRTASVSVGDTVKQGDLIAKSGNTGWSTGPHLHVQVQSNCGSWWCPSRPFRFGEKSPIVAGTTTTSKNNCP